MSTLNPNDSLENLELGAAVVSRAPASLLTKAIRGLLATAVLGSAAAYGAITVKPELVEYLSFIPGMEPVATHCTAGACGASTTGGAATTCGAADVCAESCSSAGSCSGACALETGSCCAEGATCPSTNSETLTEASSDESSGGTASAEQ